MGVTDVLIIMIPAAISLFMGYRLGLIHGHTRSQQAAVGFLKESYEEYANDLRATLRGKERSNEPCSEEAVYAETKFRTAVALLKRYNTFIGNKIDFPKEIAEEDFEQMRDS